MWRESPVKVEYTLTPEDSAAAMREHFQDALGKPRRTQYGMAAPVLALLSLGAMLAAQGVPWQVAAVFPLFGLLCSFRDFLGVSG
jgi:hypothetical protein